MKSSVTTPSGIKLYYQDEPKRFYKVNGEYVPSVTTILDVLNKPALPWWGMKIGVEGVLRLIAEQRLQLLGPVTVDDVVALLTEDKLTVNHVRDKAGERGDSAHKALENWVIHGHIVIEDYPEGDRGYVAGVLKFLEDACPDPVMSEVMVGSAEHEFAGRFDLLAYQTPQEAVIRNLKASTRKEVLPEGRYLYDLKTTKYVYDTHHLQLAAYEGGLRECGYEGTDHRAVILVSPDGKYEVHRSDQPHYLNFLAVREAYRAMRSFKKGKNASS